MARSLVLALLMALALAPAASAHAGHGDVLDGTHLRDVPVDMPTAPAGTRAMASPSVYQATGPRKVAVIQVLLSGRDTTAYPAFTDQQLTDAFFGTGVNSATSYFSELTGGTVTLYGDVRTVTISSTGGGCDSPTDAWQTWESQARAATTSLAGYNNVVFVFIGPTGCSWSGLGWEPGSTTYLDNNIWREVSVHELGHNFGLDHASSISCTDGTGARVFLSATCSWSEYGDPFDAMGGYGRRYSASHIDQAGWMPASRITTITHNGTYTLGPSADMTAQTRLLRIPRGDGSVLDVEARRPYGLFDTWSPSASVSQGVLIRIHYPNDLVQTRLLDATPWTTSFNDAALLAGQTVTDPIAHISLTTNASDSSGATVSVDLRGLGPDVTAPAQPAVTATETSGTVTLSWAPAADDVQTTHYRVYRDGVQIADTTGTTATDSTGATEWTVVALDAAGNASTPGGWPTATTPPSTGSGSTGTTTTDPGGSTTATAPTGTTPTPPPPAPDPTATTTTTTTTTPPSGTAATAATVWLVPSRIVRDGRRATVRGIAAARGGTLTGRRLDATFPAAVTRVRLRASGCPTWIRARRGSVWQTVARLPRSTRARTSDLSIWPTARVLVTCSGRGTLRADELVGRR